MAVAVALLLLLSQQALASIPDAVPPPFVGVWDSPINSLPDQRLPHVPLLGNGHLGIALNTVPSPGSGADIGPGRANTLDVWLGSNAMWSCVDCAGFANGCCGRVALGGVSISLLPTFAAKVPLAFRAEQRIGAAQLYTRWTTPANSTFETVTFMDPWNNFVVTNCTWTPRGDDPASVTIDVGTWTLTGASANEGPQPATVGCALPNQGASGPCSGAGSQYTFVSRKAVADAQLGPSFGRVWAALATAVTGATTVAYSNSTSKAAWQATVQVTVAAGSVASVLTIENENWYTEDPTPFALQELDMIEGSGGASWVEANADEWWTDFWAQSAVQFPSRPAVEEYWYGAQYILACAASSDADAPAPGLYGPWVTTDQPDWHGDYTLDYNQEATFYGAFGSNHVDQTSSYWGPILDYSGAAAKMAQAELASAHVGNCSAAALHYPCHLAPWGMQSQDQTVYMHWNGPFAVSLFINNFEYTLNASFAQYYTYPLLDGFNAWWHCFLQRTQTGPGPNDYVYEDVNQFNPDAQHEGQLVPNPQISLAFIRRTMGAQLHMAAALGISPPPYVQDIYDHLVPFNTAQASFTVANYTTWTDVRCHHDSGMHSVASVSACEALCSNDPQCALFTFCPSTSVAGCDEGPSCWTFPLEQHGTCTPFAGFVSGLRGASSTITATVWTSYSNATIADSDMFAQYPNFPAETIITPDDRRVAQASSRLYSDFINGRPVNLFPNAVRAGADPSFPPAWTPADVLDGLDAYLAASFGPNLLPYAPGGGIENVGISRAVNEMLVQTPNNTFVALFPMWPAAEPASFRNQLVKGGFLVSAAYDNVLASVTAFEVTAAYTLNGAPSSVCTVLSPWPSAKQSDVAVDCGGTRVALQWDSTGTMFSFKAPLSVLCQISVSAL
eukprot:TRINITY_DN8859_c0_g1_i1.p1 TRINITY_DN8859_c0_g1~~TRINITY_DN8859_c0_g1_i1.p1  ORF type:complete len:900 (+),score=224.85 TRINITY_DN8859_c0_g1_i1:143-2842(+)